MTAMPCGQKNKTSDISQSQTVTPPFAAMLGTTFRLNTATTNSAMRSHRPRERLRWTVSAGAVSDSDKLLLVVTGLGCQIVRAASARNPRSHPDLVGRRISRHSFG